MLFHFTQAKRGCKRGLTQTHESWAFLGYWELDLVGCVDGSIKMFATPLIGAPFTITTKTLNPILDPHAMVLWFSMNVMCS